MSFGVDVQLNGRKIDCARGGAGVDRPGEDFLARARFAGDEDRDVGRCDAARHVEDALHLLGEEDGSALTLDGIGRPQRCAIPLLLARVLECNRGTTEAKDVTEQDGLAGIFWNLTR